MRRSKNGGEAVSALKAARLAKGWSQQDLAVRAKMGVADVCRIERGWLRPYPGQAKRLARALGLRPNDLVAMTPAEFATKMCEIATVRDYEVAHRDADDLMCEVLRQFGYGEGVEVFEQMPKQYA